MRTVILEIPDEPQQLPDWLERELVGMRLGNLVAELCVVHDLAPGESDAGELESWLSTDRDPVLERGLRALPVDKLRDLLQRPQLLPALQELVLVEGGRHWQNLLATAHADRAATEPTAPIAFVSQRTELTARRWTRRRWVYAGVAIAATLLLVIGRSAFRGGDKSPTWGWNDPQLLAHQPGETAPDYLASIANAADAWSQQPRDSAQELAQSIRELRQGCDRLIADAHPALSPEDRQWLRDKCQDWRKKFDEQLVKLDQGQSFLEARDAMDKIVGTLSQKIRERAQSSSARSQQQRQPCLAGRVAALAIARRRVADW